MARETIREGSPHALRLHERLEPDLNSGCWLWSGKTVPGGYGAMRVMGKDILTHRASWTIRNGSIPVGRVVRHKCDTPSCCNPDHLVIGTLADNSRDCVVRGRHKTGERKPRLRKEQIEIIAARVTQGIKDAHIAKELGISRQAVGRRRRILGAKNKPNPTPTTIQEER